MISKGLLINEFNNMKLNGNNKSDMQNINILSGKILRIQKRFL
jgi:hypothetical protein